MHYLRLYFILLNIVSFNSFASYTQTVSSSQASEYRAIGIIYRSDYNSLQTWCTASLISTDTIVTAKHCIDGVDLTVISFIPSYESGSLSFYKKYDVVAIDRQGNGQFPSGDWVVLRINGPAGAYLNFGYLLPEMRINLDQHEIGIIGYPINRGPERATRSFGCSVLDSKNGLLRHDCDTGIGNSGSPILIKTQSGALKIIGIHVGYDSVSKVAIPIGLIL